MIISFCESTYGMNKFVEMFPELRKNICFYIILNKKRLDTLSVKDEGFNDNFDVFGY